MTPATPLPLAILQCAWCARIKCGTLWLPMPGGLVAGSHGICPQCCVRYFPLAAAAPRTPAIETCA